MAGSAVVGALRVSLTLATAAFSEGLSKSRDDLKKFGANMTAVGRTASLAISTPLAAAGALAIKVGGDFEAGMNRVKAATGAAAPEMAALRDLAKDLGRTTQFSATEAADGMETLAKNGLSTNQIMGGALAGSLKLAAAAGSDLSTAADIATDVIAQFGLKADGLGPVIDGITGVLLASKFGIDDYRLALGQAGGVAGSLGVEFEDFNAAIAATSSLFASGSDAGTAFKTFLQRLVPSSKDAAAKIEEIGLEFFDAQGNMKSVAAIAQELQDSLAGLSEEAKNDTLSTIFGSDALRTAVGLADQGAAGIERLSAAIASASADDQAAARMQGFNGALKELSSSVEALQIAIAESGLLALVTSLVAGLTDFVQNLSKSSPEVLRFGVILAGLATAIGPVLIAVGLMVTALGSLPLAAVVAGLTALTAAVVAFWPQITAAKDALVAFATEGFAGLTASFETLKTYLAGLPDQFVQIGRDIIEGLLNGIKERFAAVKDTFTNLGTSIPNWVREKLGIQSPSTVFAEIGVNIMQGLQGGLSSLSGSVEDGVTGFADTLASRFAGVLTGAVKFKDALRQTLASAASSFATQALTAGIGSLFGAMKLPAFAGGTPFAPGGLALVGERGPEVVNLPRGSQVYNNARSERMMAEPGGQPTSININLTGASGDAQIQAMIREGIRQGLAAHDASLPARVRQINLYPARGS